MLPPSGRSVPLPVPLIVRLVRAEERARWQALLHQHHYLGCPRMVGQALWYVATVGDAWVALLGWAAAALKCRPRDAWIGWAPALQWRRLPFVVNNVGFCLLPPGPRPNLASRVLALNLRRLSADWERAHGHPVLLADARSSLQVAAAEGSARKADFRLGGLLAGGGAAGALGGYGNTNEGKVIAASLADNYNGIVRSVRSNPSLQRDVASLAEEAGKRTKAGAVFNEGDVLRPKLANVKLLPQPSEQGETLAMLGKDEELIFMGKEQDGFLNVETVKGGGWVKKILLTRQERDTLA